MRIVLSFLLGAWILFSFTGCSGMIDSLREESAAIDREAGDDAPDQTEIYGYKPKSLKGLSANNTDSFRGGETRGYGRRLASFEDGEPTSMRSEEIPSVAPEYRRVTRRDFVDSAANENSLWDAQGQGNYLFSHNRQRESGDLVTVDVEKELKREIQYQLWMTLPPEQRKIKRLPASTGGDQAKAEGEKKPEAPAAKATEEKARDAAEEAAKTNLASGGKDDDIVRMEVAENLGNGLVRVVGQKRVIYRGAARVVEVMALVNNKDVDDGNRVKSSTFLDMKTQVIQ